MPHMNTNVLVSTNHPVLGRVYWSFQAESTAKADQHGLTCNREHALRLPAGWRDMDYLWFVYGYHMHTLLDENRPGSHYHVDHDAGDEDPDQGKRLTGTLLELQQRSRQSVEQFRDWMLNAPWADIPDLGLVPATDGEAGIGA